MNVSQLTDLLQTIAHSGHATDEVDFQLGEDSPIFLGGPRIVASHLGEDTYVKIIFEKPAELK